MQYMLAIMYDPTLPDDGVPTRQPLHAALAEEMRAKGQSRGGAGLAPIERYRKAIRTVDGEKVFSDGPFAETREVLGGYFLVECSEEEAIAWAKRIDVDAGRSWVEIRAAWVDPKG